MDKFKLLLKRERLLFFGIGMGIYYFFMKIMIGNLIGSNAFMNIVYVVCYIVGLAAFIVLSTASFYYYTKKRKDKSILIVGSISSIVTIFTLLGLQAVVAILKLGTEDYFSILYAYEEILSSLGMYQWAMYVSWLSALYSLILVLEMKGIMHIDAIHKMVGEVGVETEEKQAENLDEVNIEKKEASKPKKEQSFHMKETFQKHKKAMKLCILTLSLIVISGIGYGMYKKYFSFTNVSLIKSIEIKYSGLNGEGYATVNADDGYEGNDVDIHDFLNSVYYKVEVQRKKNGDLSNGDTVTVKAMYSEKRANELNIKIEKDNYQAKVSGLAIVYTKGTDIPVDILEKMKTDASKEAEASNKYETSANKRKIAYHSSYFIKNTSSSTILMVYKETPLISSGNNDEKVKNNTRFKAYYVRDPRSDYGKDGKRSYWYSRILVDSRYSYIQDEKDILPALTRSFYVELNQIETMS